MSKNFRNILSLFLFILLSWGIYRYFTRYPEWVDDFVSKPLLWLVPTFFLVFVVEKKSLVSIGLTSKKLKRDAMIGLLIGIVFSAELILSVSLHHKPFMFSMRDFTFTALTMNFLESLATGIVEEIVFRGYIQTRLSQVMKGTLMPIIMSSVLFVLSHFPLIIFVFHYSFANMLSYSLLIFVLGMLNGFVFTKTKTVTAPIVMHTVWDFVSYIVR